MRVTCAVALTVVLSAAAAGAQPRQPAFLEPAAAGPKLQTLHLEARVDGPVRVGADGRGSVTLAVVPRAGMHVYAADAEGYVPFTLKLTPPAVLTAGKVSYPAAEISVFPPTGETSRVYTRPFAVTVTFGLTADARRTLAATGTLSATAALRYQACDDRVCYRPTSGTVTFAIEK